jgi:plastocyanin
MKNLALLAILTASVLIAGCTQQNPTPSGNPNAVTIQNSAFNPSTLSVKVGTTVTWTNQDSIAHTVTSDSGNELDSGPIPSGQNYSHTFNAAGNFSYHCSIHNMKAQVVVE